MNVAVHIIDMGAAADVKACRYDLPNGSVIVIHHTVPFDQQAELLADLTVYGETPVIEGLVVPVQRRPSASARRLRVAAAVASLSGIAACAAPPVAG